MWTVRILSRAIMLATTLTLFVVFVRYSDPLSRSLTISALAGSAPAAVDLLRQVRGYRMARREAASRQ
jgi:hypothetical protein